MSFLKGFMLLLTLGISCASIAQTPGGINYQGVARNQLLGGLNNDSIQLRFTVKEKTPIGNTLYTETRGTRTDSFGVFNVVIGSTGAINSSGNIKQVTWSDTTKKFLMVEMNILDPNIPGFLNMGTTQLLSVPFSFYSDISDSARAAAKADSAKFSKGSGQHFFSVSLNLFNAQPIPNYDNDELYLHTLRFPVVNQNEGGNFRADSVFIAPDSGYYQFDFNLSLEYLLQYDYVSNGYVELYFGIAKNGKILKVLNKDVYENLNGSVRVKLQKNDKISIKMATAYELHTNVRFQLDFDPIEFNETYEPVSMSEFSGYKIK